MELTANGLFAQLPTSTALGQQTELALDSSAAGIASAALAQANRGADLLKIEAERLVSECARRRADLLRAGQLENGVRAKV